MHWRPGVCAVLLAGGLASCNVLDPPQRVADPYGLNVTQVGLAAGLASALSAATSDLSGTDVNATYNGYGSGGDVYAFYQVPDQDLAAAEMECVNPPTTLAAPCYRVEIHLLASSGEWANPTRTQKIMCHELGHAVGLNHDTVEEPDHYGCINITNYGYWATALSSHDRGHINDWY